MLIAGGTYYKFVEEDAPDFGKISSDVAMWENRWAFQRKLSRDIQKRFHFLRSQGRAFLNCKDIKIADEWGSFKKLNGIYSFEIEVCPYFNRRFSLICTHWESNDKGTLFSNAGCTRVEVEDSYAYVFEILKQLETSPKLTIPIKA